MKAVVDRSDDPVTPAPHAEPAAPPSRARFAAFAILFGLASGIALYGLLTPDAGWPVLLLVLSLCSCLSSLAAMFVFRRMQLPLEAAHSLQAEQALRLQAYEDLSLDPPPAPSIDVMEEAAPSVPPSALIEARNVADAQRRLTSAVLAASRDSLLIIGRDGRIEAASPAAAALIELTPAELRDRLLASLYPLFDDTRPEPLQYPLNAALQRLLGDGAVPDQTFAALLERRGRTSVRLRLHGQPLRDVAGRVQALLLRLDPLDEQTQRPADRYETPAVELSEPTDPLTGAHGPQHLRREIDRLQHEARLDSTEHGLLLIAVDPADARHEQIGIAAGEQRLWQLAQTIRDAASAAKGFHRLSASHFALLLPRQSLDACVARAEALCAAVAAQPWPDDDQGPRLRVGVVAIDGSPAAADLLIDAATEALRCAHTLGKGCVQRADIAVVDADVGDWLSRKIAGGALRLAAQAILPTEPAPGSHEAPWLELLLRIEDDDGVWLPLDSFAAMVERLGLSVQVDDWLLDTALKHAIGSTRLLIALSAASLGRDDFLNGLRTRLLRSAVPTPQLFFAVDERYILEHPQRAAALRDLLSSFGCGLAVDHHRGGGGVTALRQFPARIIKLHESLVARSSTDLVDRAHLEWLVTAARLMGARTVAAAVRDADTQERMRLAKVDYVQGYAVAPPVPFSS